MYIDVLITWHRVDDAILWYKVHVTVLLVVKTMIVRTIRYKFLYRIYAYFELKLDE